MFQLSDKDLIVLSLYIPISQIPHEFEGISPARRTIYRRLHKYGVTKPEERRMRFIKQELLKPHFAELSDDECKSTLNRIMSDLFEEEATAIKERIKRSQEFYK